MRHRGFTLLEMAITLAIAGILLAGLIMTLGAQQEASREAETRRYLSLAKEALYGFAMANGRLPCPANPAIAAGAANAGVEQYANGTGCTTAGATVFGALPWATLGLSETDAYGARLSYAVSSAFAEDPTAPPAGHFACLGAGPPPPPTPRSAFALCHVGTMRVNNLGGAGAPLADNVPAVLVSHGPNREGSYNSSGVQFAANSADEIENSDADLEFRAGGRRDASAAAGEFDDEVEWIVPSILMHRMVQAGRLP